MPNVFKRIEASLLAGQHGHPTGLIGRMLGEKMVRQHVPETTWTIELLDLKPGDHVLELGFGAGRAIELVAARVPNGQVAGIDISQEMVRSASRRNARAIKAGQVRLSCTRAIWSRFPIPTASSTKFLPSRPSISGRIFPRHSLRYFVSSSLAAN